MNSLDDPTHAPKKRQETRARKWQFYCSLKKDTFNSITNTLLEKWGTPGELKCLLVNKEQQKFALWLNIKVSRNAFKDYSFVQKKSLKEWQPLEHQGFKMIFPPPSETTKLQHKSRLKEKNHVKIVGNIFSKPLSEVEDEKESQEDDVISENSKFNRKRRRISMESTDSSVNSVISMKTKTNDETRTFIQRKEKRDDKEKEEEEEEEEEEEKEEDNFDVEAFITKTPFFIKRQEEWTKIRRQDSYKISFREIQNSDKLYPGLLEGFQHSEKQNVNMIGLYHMIQIEYITFDQVQKVLKWRKQKNTLNLKVRNFLNALIKQKQLIKLCKKKIRIE